MAEVLARCSTRLIGNGVRYVAQACGAPRGDGLCFHEGPEASPGGAASS
jgi:hypothetical protein